MSAGPAAAGAGAVRPGDLIAPRGQPPPLVRLDEMTRRFGSVTAADRVTFDVRRGEMFGLIGPDGAGKTTTLRVALGLLKADEGRVETCGLEPLARHRELTARVGYLSQRFSLYGDLTVDENIAFFAEIHGVRGWKPRRESLLELVRLAPFRQRLADRLSGGMKQKLALACTLVHTPQLLVLDEPTTGVDPVSRRDFWKLLAQVQREGLTILLTTPYLDEAERCQRVALMDRGRRPGAAPPGERRAQAAVGMPRAPPRPRRRAVELLADDDAVAEIETFGERLHVALRGVPPSEAEAAASRLAGKLREAGVDLEFARPTAPSLEDVFIHRIRQAATAEATLARAAGRS